MQFEYSQEFLDSVQSLPESVKKKLSKALRLFDSNFWHPSLHTEKLTGVMFAGSPVWSIRLDKKYRIIFTILKERNNIFLINISKHYE